MIDVTSIPGLVIGALDTTLGELTNSLNATTVSKIIIRAPTTVAGSFIDTTIEAKQEYDLSGNLGWSISYGASKFFATGVTAGSLTTVIGAAAVAVVGAPLTPGIAIAVGIGSAVVATGIWDSNNAEANLRLLISDPNAFAGMVSRDFKNLYLNTRTVNQNLPNLLHDYSYDASKNIYKLYNNVTTQAQYYGEQLTKLAKRSTNTNTTPTIIDIAPSVITAATRDAFVGDLIKGALTGAVSISDFKETIKQLKITHDNQIGEYIVTDTNPQTLLQQHKGATFINVTNGTETITLTNTSGQPVAYLTKKTSATLTTATGQTVNRFAVLEDIALIPNRIASFFTDYIRETTKFYESDAGTAAFQSALAQIAVRLANGEDFNVVMNQTAAQLLLGPGVNNLFNQLVVGSNLVPANYQLYASQALANATIQGLLNGDFPAALQNASVQAAVQGGVVNNLDFLTKPDAFAPIRDPNTNQITGYGKTLNAAGVGVTAAVVSLFGSLLNGGINGAAINNALKAGTIAFASSVITTALVGTAAVTATATTAAAAATSGLIASAGAAAGPIGIAVAFALSYLTKGLFAPTQYIHGETIGNITQTQADGSLLLIGTRPAGSLLRTTGTTNDDFIGNDSATDTAGHDVIVGQAGMNEIYARGGHDMMEGRAAADYIEAGTGDDRVEAGDGNDFADGGTGNDQLIGGTEDDTLDGGIGDDVLASEVIYWLNNKKKIIYESIAA